MIVSAKDSPQWIQSTVRPGDVIISNYGVVNAPGAPMIARATQYVMIFAGLNAQSAHSVPLRLVRPKAATGKPRAKSWRERARDKWIRSPGVGRKAAEYAGYAADIEEVDDHPVLDFLRKPNPFMTGAEMELQWYLNMDIAGNSYEWFYEDPASGGEVYSLSPAYVRIIPSETEFIAQYIYARDPTQVSFFDRDAIGHARFRVLSDPYYGVGPLHTVMIEADLVSAATTAEQYRWQNGGRPDWVFESSVPLNDRDQREALRAELDRNVKGVNRAGRSLIVSNGKIVVPGFAPKDMEYMSGMSRCDAIIANAFGVPEAVYKMNDANRASSDNAHRQYMLYTIGPRTVKRCEYLNAEYLPRFGVAEGEMWFVPDNPAAEDEAAETERLISLSDAGIVTLNEVRAQEGLDPFPPEIGDVPRYKGVELVSAADKAKQDAATLAQTQAHQMNLETVRQGANQPPDPAEGAKNLAEALMGKAVELVREARAESPIAVNPEPEVKAVDTVERFKSLPFYGHAHKGLEVPTEVGVPAEVDKVRGEFNDRLRSWYEEALYAYAQDGSVTAETMGELDAKLETIAREYIARIANIGVNTGADKIGFSFDMHPRPALAFMETYTPKLVDAVTLDVQTSVRDTIAEGLANGESIPEITKRIQAEIPGIAQWKAERVARTETMHALAQGERATMKAAGMGYKEWLLSGNPCELCIAVAAIGPVPIDQHFADPGFFDNQCPPLHPNCACSCLYHLENPAAQTEGST